jgi:hypothetical protein
MQVIGPARLRTVRKAVGQGVEEEAVAEQRVKHADSVGIAVIPETALHHQKKLAIQVVQLTDSWAVRKLMICVRRFKDLSPHAKHLIEHLGLAHE